MSLTPVLLVDINHSGTHYRYSSFAEGCYYDDDWYDGRILENFSIRERLTEQFYGFTEFSDVTVTLDNHDGTFSTLYGTADLRHDEVWVARVDKGTATYWVGETLWLDSDIEWDSDLEGEKPYAVSEDDAVVWQAWGRVKQFRVGDEAEVVVEFTRDLEPFDVLLPKDLVDTSVTWANEETPGVKKAYEASLGKPVPILFGHAYKVPILLINNDLDNDKYDYLIGYGTTESNDSNSPTTVTVYRNGAKVLDSEFTCHDGSQASPYSGKAFLRFSLEQRDFSGGFYTLHASWRGLELTGSTAERNFVRVIQYLLSNSTWGLGQTVDTSSFDSAAAVAEVAALYCDGALYERRKALDAFNELLFCARARLWRDPSSGSWKIEVDQAKSATKVLYQGSEGHQDNIVSVDRVYKRETSDCTKDLTFQYGYSPENGTWRYHTDTRTVCSGFGSDREEELPWVQDHETADRIACYAQRLEYYTDDWVELTVGADGRYLEIGDVVELDVPRFSLDGFWKIVEIERGVDVYKLTLCSYSYNVYVYGSGTLPDDDDSPEPTDWSKTDPDAPINFTIDSSDDSGSVEDGGCIDIDDDGGVTAAAWLSAEKGTTNPDNFSYMKFRIKRYSFDITVDGKYNEPSDKWEALVRGLELGATYTFYAIAVNQFGRETSTSGTSKTVADKTTIIPAYETISNVSAAAMSTSGIRLRWQNGYRSKSDHAAFAGVRIWRQTTTTFAGGDPITEIECPAYPQYTEYQDLNVVSGTTYYYWIKEFDTVGNKRTPSTGDAYMVYATAP